MDESTSVTLAGKAWPLVWNRGLIEYRLQALPGGRPPFSDFTNPEKDVRAAASYVWAMLPREARALYPDPEDIAAQLTKESIVTAALAVFAALDASVKDAKDFADVKVVSPKKAKPGSRRSSK